MRVTDMGFASLPLESSALTVAPPLPRRFLSAATRAFADFTRARRTKFERAALGEARERH